MASMPTQVIRPPELILHMGRGLSYAGDINGDGIADLLIGARGETTGMSAVFVYPGSTLGVGAAPATTLSGDNVFRFGEGLSTAGDVNGDGYADVVIGSPGANTNRGLVRLHLGSVDGLLPAPSFTFNGTADGGLCGSWVSGGGDFNGDGYDDIAVACEQERRLRVFYGAPAGVRGEPALLQSPSGSETAFFQARVGLVGDVNGDGYVDLVASAPGFDAGRGIAYFFAGSADGLATRPSWEVRGEAEADNLGIAIGRQ